MPTGRTLKPAGVHGAGKAEAASEEAITLRILCAGAVGVNFFSLFVA